MKHTYFIRGAFLFFLSSVALAQETPFKTLACTPTQEDATIEVIFPRETYASRPFTRFAEIWAQVTVEHRKLRKKYVRDKVLFIPETRPPGSDMRGQSSDSLYIQLHPQFSNGRFSGTYFGQLFINDKDPEFRGTYFRWINSEEGPGIICHPSL